VCPAVCPRPFRDRLLVAATGCSFPEVPCFAYCVSVIISSLFPPPSPLLPRSILDTVRVSFSAFSLLRSTPPPMSWMILFPLLSPTVFVVLSRLISPLRGKPKVGNSSSAWTLSRCSSHPGPPLPFTSSLSLPVLPNASFRCLFPLPFLFKPSSRSDSRLKGQAQLSFSFPFFGVVQAFSFLPRTRLRSPEASLLLLSMGTGTPSLLSCIVSDKLGISPFLDWPLVCFVPQCPPK